MQIQLEQIYKEVAKNRMLDFDIVPVQQQKGAADCGVHSVANAFNAAIGKKLGNNHIIYNQEKMGEHLQNCFEEQCLKTFTESQGSKRTKM